MRRRHEGLAGEILRRHENAEPEANITSAVRDFLIGTGLARANQIVEENPPAQASRRAVDLTALDTFIEVKRRIGARAGFSPDESYVEQLDDYLDQSEKSGKRSRMGILTDGKYWLLRWPERWRGEDGAAEWVHAGRHGWGRGPAVRVAAGPGAGLQSEHSAARPGECREALRTGQSALRQGHCPPAGAVRTAQRTSETVQVKRRLWDNLLRAALGEVAGTRRGAGRPVRAPYVSDRGDRPGGAGDVRR